MDKAILTNNDLMLMLDELLRDQEAFWDEFYTDREKPVPFFVNAPDESLVKHFENGRMKSGRVLDIGCGPGRNSIYFARQGCEVDAVDISRVSLDWARERAEEQESSGQLS
jgi:2-polyprenyl-3-methyl-5-hydroxy-6-metoxy-1,4-benzoquinol methylase